MTDLEITSANNPPVRRARPAPLRVTGCLLLLGSVGILLASQQSSPVDAYAPGSVAEVEPRETPLLPPGFWETARYSHPEAAAPEIPGPPVPETRVAAAVPGSTSSGAGSIGFIGPIAGPLNAEVNAGGPVFGPGWARKPLPNVLAGPPIPTGLAVSTPEPPPGPADPASSELPDEKTVALSRLANPQLEVRQTAPAKAETASTENPLSVQLTLKNDDIRTGQPVSVKVSANIACYAALVLVDATGKSSTIFQTVRPTKEFTCLVKAGPEAGAEYLLAVASAQPLNTIEMASALRTAATGFTPAKVTEAAGETPPAAWTVAVTHIDGLDGAAKKLQRFEWALSTATFVTRPPVLTAVKPKIKAAEPKAESGPPAAPDSSALPQSPAKSETKPAQSPGTQSVLPE